MTFVGGVYVEYRNGIGSNVRGVAARASPYVCGANNGSRVPLLRYGAGAVHTQFTPPVRGKYHFQDLGGAFHHGHGDQRAR